MSLTVNDLEQIRSVFESVFDAKVLPRLEKLESEVKALRNDIKDILDELAVLSSRTITDESFKRLSLEEKLITLNSELLLAAKQAGIELPRS